MKSDWNEGTVTTNGINLHVVEAGPEDGVLVVLLHGFPEFWYGWRAQLDALAGAGYRVVAPDQRGYNLSDKPGAVREYRIDVLARDVLGLIDHYGREKAIVVGHDWGAAVAWWLGARHPERLEKLCVLNVPHPAVMQRALRSNLRQLTRSWYLFFFQLPWLPETVFLAAGCRLALRALATTSRPGTFSSDDLARYREAWSRRGAIRGMVNWYRAAFRRRPSSGAGTRVSVPTLLIWGTSDAFLGRELAQPSIDLCDTGRLVFLEGVSHWVQHEEPAKVNALMTGFFQAG